MNTTHRHDAVSANRVRHTGTEITKKDTQITGNGTWSPLFNWASVPSVWLQCSSQWSLHQTTKTPFFFYYSLEIAFFPWSHSSDDDHWSVLFLFTIFFWQTLTTSAVHLQHFSTSPNSILQFFPLQFSFGHPFDCFQSFYLWHPNWGGELSSIVE